MPSRTLSSWSTTSPDKYDQGHGAQPEKYNAPAVQPHDVSLCLYMFACYEKVGLNRPDSGFEVEPPGREVRALFAPLWLDLHVEKQVHPSVEQVF